MENVTSANRPSVLEGNFVIFRDCEGMDAVEALQKMRSRSKGQDPWKDEFLDKYVACMIFEVFGTNLYYFSEFSHLQK